MNWPQSEVDKLYRERGEKPPQTRITKPTVRVELGEWVSESFFLSGSIPSKKNRKRAIIKSGEDGQQMPGLITDGEVQKQLAQLTNLCAHRWHLVCKWPLTNATLELVFYVSHRRQDLDNAASSVLDSLVTGGVLRTDSMTHLKELKLAFQVVDKGMEGVYVIVKGQEYIERVVRAA